MRIQRKARAHEDVQDIVHVGFREAVADGLPRQIGMTTHVTLCARH